MGWYGMGWDEIVDVDEMMKMNWIRDFVVRGRQDLV